MSLRHDNARIGVIQPAPGVMLESEWPDYLPAGVLFPVGRVRLTAASAEGYDAVAAQAPEAARDLASAGAELIAFACTVGSLYAGPDAEGQLVDAITRASGLPAISLAAACIAAFRRLGVTRPALLTPYGEETNELVVRYAAGHGIGINGAHRSPLGLAEVGTLDGPAIAALCVDVLSASPQADALWLPCTAMRTIEAIPYVEAIGGVPVVSGAQALLWGALGALDLGPPRRPAGRLFNS